MELKRIRALSRQLHVRRPRESSIKVPAPGAESQRKTADIVVGTSLVVADPILTRIGAAKRLSKKGVKHD